MATRFGRSGFEMARSLNIFGPTGSMSESIVSHFDAMKLEAIKAFQYSAIDSVKLGLILDEIIAQEEKLSKVFSDINMQREKVITILEENNIIEE
jgi:hypothetical protein